MRVSAFTPAAWITLLFLYRLPFAADGGVLTLPVNFYWGNARKLGGWVMEECSVKSGEAECPSADTHTSPWHP